MATTNDTISGNAAGDSLFGDNGDDLIYGDADTPDAACDGVDTARGGPLDDYAFGNDKGDNIFGDGGIDRLVGGSDDVNELDGGDAISGGVQNDVIAGDNAIIGDATAADDMLVTLRLDGQGAGDTINGDSGDDRIFGQLGGDTINGNEHADYVEGNDGDDTIHGNDGDDDLIGGGSANDGIIDADRVGNGLSDVGETLVAGDGGEDWMTGDNALIDRNAPIGAPAPIVLFDVETTTTSALPGTGGGEVLMTGGDGPDWMFGQTGNDTMQGDAGTEYIEGNNGNDAITGNADNDDLVGGGSANDGVIDANRVGNTLLDVGETLISGGPDQDWITGDNSLVNRNRPAAGRAPIELFDVQTVGTPIATTVSGGDVLSGDEDEDRIFGQGNGAQPATQTDPDDERNNDFVGTLPASADFDRLAGTADENAGTWSGDIIRGGLGDDEIEGNHGNDLIFGNGTAGSRRMTMTTSPAAAPPTTARSDDDRLGLGANLLDGHDTIHGDSTDDAVGDDDAAIGDNGWVRRLGTSQAGPGPDGLPVDLVGRDVQMVQVRPANGTFGNDHVLGNGAPRRAVRPGRRRRRRGWLGLGCGDR